jgi:L-ascorbate metabolism protein UlaG (beta-lactamase superfamily)
MIAAFQKNETLLADIVQNHSQSEGFRLWWLGQSGFLVQWQGKHLLLDPYLSDSLTDKYAQTDKPHTRLSERVIDPALLAMVDVVTSSHNHTDHLDAATLLPLLRANPQLAIVCPEANRHFVCQRLAIPLDRPLGLNDGQQVEVAGFTLHGVPAAHNDLARDEAGQCLYMGFVVSFGPYKIYHSGDTLWYEGMVELLKPFAVDVAFLPINGNKPERRVAGNLNPQEAAQVGKAIGAKCVIPHHYDMFEFNTEDPQAFVAAAQTEQTPHQVLRLGEKWDSANWINA